MVCVTLPARLRLTAAPAATSDGTQVCWRVTDLVTGHPRTFRLRARIAAAHTSGATLAVHGRLTGENFGVAGAAASVQVPRRAVACPSRVLVTPRARIAC